MVKFSIFVLLFILCLACKKEKQDTDCIDPQKIELNKACIEIYPKETKGIKTKS